MIKVENWLWVVNCDDMTCKNIENKVTVKMEKVNGNLKAQLHDMPMELFAEISGHSDGEKIIGEIVRMAGEAYQKTYPQ